MPLASQAKYIENRKEVPIGQGIWQAPLAVDFHRSLLDVDTCETFTEIIHTSSSHPYVIGTRLKIVDNRISEVESLVTDKDDWLFNAADICINTFVLAGIPADALQTISESVPGAAHQRRLVDNIGTCGEWSRIRASD